MSAEQKWALEGDLMETSLLLINWYQDISDNSHSVSARAFEYNDIIMQIALKAVHSIYQKIRPDEPPLFSERSYVTKILDEPLRAIEFINGSIENIKNKIKELQKPEFVGKLQHDFNKNLLITVDCLQVLREEKSIIPLFDITDINFKPSYFVRYENSKQTAEPNYSKRLVKIEINTEGLGGYTVTIYNVDGINPFWGNNIQMSPKQMTIIAASENQTILRGWGSDPKAGGDPAGLFSNYGLTIYHQAGVINKIVSHMHDRGIDIEYLK